MQLKAPFTFPTKSPSNLFRFIQSPFPSKEAIHAEDRWTLGNSIVIAGVATVNKRNTDKDNAWYTATMHLPQGYLKQYGSHE